MPAHVHLLIHGRVHGVWFRETARRQAEALDLKGYARNRPDGTVEIEAEGDPAALDQLVAWCHQGPALAQVARVDVTPGEFRDYPFFEVRRGYRSGL